MKDKVFTIRMTELDYLAIKENADKQNLSVSEYMRRSAMADEVKLKPNDIIFKSEEHKDFYFKMKEKCGKKWDNSRRALFYSLGSSSACIDNIKDLYDFKIHAIKRDLFDKYGWQTASGIRATALGFNLFNGDDNVYVLPEMLFGQEDDEYYIQAIKLRYPNSFQKTYDVIDENENLCAVNESFVLAKSIANNGHGRRIIPHKFVVGCE